MGALTPKDYFVKNNMLAISKAIFTGSAPETAPADIQQKIGNVGKVIREYSWKMIYAKNEAEYNKLKQEMVTKAKGLGYDDAVAWEVDLAKRTVWAAAKK
jgi:putative aldouronate transport system substrate-binding protein